MSLIDTFFNPDVILSSLPSLLRGFLNTLLLGILSIGIGIPIGPDIHHLERVSRTLQLGDTRHDCDADALLVPARPAGPVCHLGTAGCFGDEAVTPAEGLAFVAELEQIIVERIAGSPEGSYTAALYRGGVRHMAQKVGEEGLEVALAATGEADERLLGEAADLLFHLLVLLRSRGLGVQAVVEELRHRHAQRNMNAP